jgi:hypothetical protein
VNKYLLQTKSHYCTQCHVSFLPFGLVPIDVYSEAATATQTSREGITFPSSQQMARIHPVSKYHFLNVAMIDIDVFGRNYK